MDAGRGVVRVPVAAGLLSRAGRADDGGEALYRGLPHLLRLTKESSLCSIPFHLLVPGGRRQTLISMQGSCVGVCCLTFHNRTRFPLEPPQSAMICSFRAPEPRSLLRRRRQCRMPSTTNAQNRFGWKDRPVTAERMRFSRYEDMLAVALPSEAGKFPGGGG